MGPPSGAAIEEGGTWSCQWTAGAANGRLGVLPTRMDSCGGQSSSLFPVPPLQRRHELSWEWLRSPGRNHNSLHNNTHTLFFLHREMTLRQSFLEDSFLPETSNATQDPKTLTHVQHARNLSLRVSRQRVQFSAILVGTGPISHAQHLRT